MTSAYIIYLHIVLSVAPDTEYDVHIFILVSVSCPGVFTGLPKRPMELRLVENKPNHLRLEWRIDSSDEFPANELRFRITRVTESVADLPDRTVTGIIHSSGQFLLDKLLPRTKYILRVYSINQHGTSLHSIDREFTTEGEYQPLNHPFTKALV